MIINPYDTTYGSLINIGKVKKSVSEYIITTRLRNLNYEFTEEDGVRLVFLTGCTPEEKEIPTFDHPIITEDRKGKIVTTDLRKYMRSIDEQPLYLFEASKDVAALTFLISRAMFTAGFLTGNYGIYRKFFKSAITSYADLISHAIDVIVKLNPLELYKVKLTAGWFAYTLFVDDDVEDYGGMIEAMLGNCKLGIGSNKNVIKEVVSIMNDMRYTPTIGDLVTRIKAILPEDKQVVISVDILVNVISNLWYGHGGSETMIISIEHMPTWLALSSTALGDNTYKRTRLSAILSKFSKDIGSDYYKNVELMIKERTTK